MRRVRRGEPSARVEMMPLIDVVFLLLTFFIFALMVTVQAEVLPVALSPVGTGEAAQPAVIVAITIDADGAFYYDREPVTGEELDRRLEAIATSDPESRPRLFVAMEEALAEEEPPEGEGDVDAGGDPLATDAAAPVIDRGPLLIRLIARLRAAGINDFSFIGDPG